MLDTGTITRNNRAEAIIRLSVRLFEGFLVASLSIPWGQARGDAEGMGGYHLVWTRDMVNGAMALLAAGNTTTPLRALMYLAASQLPDGGFPQSAGREETGNEGTHGCHRP
jgi:glucoamylase